MYSVMWDGLIPVVFPEGGRRMCSVAEIFSRAHEMRDIAAYSDQTRLALLRLIMVVFMDAYAPGTRYDRADLLDAGRFDPRVLETYAALCEKDGPRFELFDPVRPFLQCAYDPKLDARAEKPVSVLIPEFASGNNSIFFIHLMEDEHALTPSMALQGMLVTYLFSTAGAQAFPSGINNTPPAYALLEGENLFETIVKNSLSVEECEAQGISYGRGEVPWRTDETVTPKKLFHNVSLLQAFTWRPRRLTLKQNPETELVERVCFQQGHNFLGNGLWRDPHVPRFQKKDGSFANLKPELGRALWRDAGTLVSRDAECRPPVITEYMEIADRSERERLNVSLTGLITSQASILGAVREQLSMPAGLLRNEGCAVRFVRDLAFLEDAQRVLTRAVAARMPKDIARQAQETFLKGAHDFLFGAYLSEMTEIEREGAVSERLAALRARVDEAVAGNLRAALDAVVRRGGTDAEGLIRQAQIERIVLGWFYKQRKGREEV